MYKHLLLPTDGTAISIKAAISGIKLAKGFKAKVTAVFVLPPYSRRAVGGVRGTGTQRPTKQEYERASVERAEAVLARVEREAKTARVRCATVVAWNDDPAEGIVETARAKRCDLIVMPSNNRRGLERFFLGSVASEVLTDTRIPVLVLR